MPDLLRKLLGRKPAPRLTDEDIDLEQFFTDAEHALQVFEDLVSATRPPKHLLVIHGVGGVGKSTVLKMYRLSCRRQRIPVALVGGEEAPSLVDVLADWADDLSGDSVKLSTFQATLTHYRALQAKVEAEAKKTGQAMAKAAGELGKVAAKTAVEMVASTIPVVGPLASALGGAGAEAFVDWLRGFLSKPDLELYLDPTKRLTDDFLSNLTRAVARQRIVLMADTYEQMTTLDDWLRDLARRLSENVLLVIAGRAMPEWDRAWPGWMGRAEIVELKEMTPDDLRTLVRRYYAHIRGGEPDPQQVEAIVQFARGLPMAATTVVQLWVRHGVEEFQAVRPQVVADLVDRLLEGVPPEMRPAFEVAAVLRYFNADVLRALLEDGDADTLYAELRRWPFIRPRREGLAVHNTMREMMNEALRVRTPERFHALHERAAAYYEARMEKASGDEHERLTLEWLYHHIRADEEEGMQLFQEMAEELARYRLINRLRALLNDVNTYPLERENSRLWGGYYNARLAHLEARLSDAEKVYQAVGENDQAEPKLRAYALCSLGIILSRWQRLGKPGEIEKATTILEQSLRLVPLDAHLVASTTRLAHLYRYQGEWDKAVMYNEKFLQFFKERGDKYGLVRAYGIKKMYHAGMGEWKEMFAMHELGIEASSALAERSYVRAWFPGTSSWAWAFAGRYAEAEHNLREGLAIAQHLDDIESVYWSNMQLGLLFGRQSRYREANDCFTESQNIVQKLGEYYQTHLAYIQGFWGVLLTRQGKWDEAERKLTDSLTTREKFQLSPDIPEVLVWLGQLHEAQQRWDTALHWYSRSLEMKWTGRRNFECEALVGICRVKYQLGEFAAILPLLAEAEQLAQQYEYNDHLASLRLTQGYIACDGRIPEWGSGFDAALPFYQQALIYALRYNRFLLDEVLWGGGVATPLRPIIPYCLERGKEGRRMLIALRDWWQTGANDIGTPRPDTISPTPEGIPLLKAERVVRECEPGDGSSQQTVVEWIEETLG